jgi:hypothetical protein
MSWNATAQEIAPGDLPDPGLRAQELVDLGLRNLGKSDLEKYHAAAIEQWSPAIAELEAKDQAETHPDNSILFVGSSSIRRWDDIATDMAPYHPIQRGYGGAKWTDVAIFAERLIAPHKFRAVVFFVGNDITGAAEDRTPEEVATLFAYVLARVREHDAMAPVFYVAVTPTESRWHAWPQIRAGNMAVRQLCERLKNTYFIGTESLYLDAKGYPRPELFVADKLHLSRSGYLHWSAAIKSHLDTVVQSPILPRFTGQTDATAGQ